MLGYSTIITVKGGEIKVKRKLVIAGVEGGSQRMGRTLFEYACLVFLTRE
jgi:hypothetical protein